MLNGLLLSIMKMSAVKDVCSNLLDLMKGGRSRVYDYGAAFIVILTAGFEANINDWLIIDTFEKHGPENYENLVSKGVTH